MYGHSYLPILQYNFADFRKKYSIGGICAMCPEITFEDKVFCFTGESYRATHAEMGNIVKDLGGKVRSGISAKTNYLVVGNAGNPCWAYACYGRKIEETLADEMAFMKSVIKALSQEVAELKKAQ